MAIVGLLCLGIIITVHELGHYIFAKLFKVRIHEFAIGIGPKIYSRQGKHTLFTLRAFPLGGFCRLETTDMDALAKIDPQEKNEPVRFLPDSLYAVPYRKKLLILLGGIITNIVFFYILYFSLFLFRYQEEVLPSRIVPIENSIALEAGLQSGDTIISINNSPIHSFNDIRSALAKFKKETLIINYERNGKNYTTETQIETESPLLGVFPFIEAIAHEFNTTSKAHLAGIQIGDKIQAINTNPVNSAFDYYRVLESISNQMLQIDIIKKNGSTTSLSIEVEQDPIKELGIGFPSYKIPMTFKMFLQSTNIYITEIVRGTFSIFFKLLLLNTKEISENATGPIRLIAIIGSSTTDSLVSDGIWRALLGIIRITALISLAIGIFNLLPIPVLDGGHIIFHGIFRLCKRTPSYRALTIFNSIGFILLMSLFILVIFKDISFLLQS